MLVPMLVPLLLLAGTGIMGSGSSSGSGSGGLLMGRRRRCRRPGQVLPGLPPLRCPSGP
jgi:hypothetical protein